MGTDQSPVLNIVILREEEVAPYLAGQIAPPPLIEHVTDEVAEPVAEAVETADASTPPAE
jgi:hypothetical protein